MIYSLERKILDMLPPSINDEKANELIDSWNAYFNQTKIPPEKQEQEFDAIMRAKVQSGSISMTAPHVLWFIEHTLK